jgi:hypothetical protein
VKVLREYTYAEGINNVLDLVDAIGLAKLLGALRVEKTKVGVQRFPELGKGEDGEEMRVREDEERKSGSTSPPS